MASGFDRLRVGVALGTIGTVALGVAPSARAAPAPLPQDLTFHRTVTAQHTKFDYKIASSSSGPFGAVGAFGVTDAKIIFTGNSCTIGFMCHHTTGKVTSDTFDGAAELKVGGDVFKTPSGIVDRSNDSAGNDQITTPSVKMSGVRVTVSHTLLKGRTVLRSLYTFTNRSRKAKRPVVQIGTDFGHESGVANFASSDGNQNVDQHDSWFNLTGTGGANLLIARGDRRGANDVLISAPSSTSDDFIDQFALRVRKHRTVRLLYFTDISRPNVFFNFPPPGGNYQTGNDLGPGGLLDGMTSEEKAQVVNWSIPH